MKRVKLEIDEQSVLSFYPPNRGCKLVRDKFDKGN